MNQSDIDRIKELDEDKPRVILNCHPTWRVEYLDMQEGNQNG